jgi:hypothetical protein
MLLIDKEIYNSLFSSVVEHQSCKLGVPSSILGKGTLFYDIFFLKNANKITLTN